MLCFSADIKSNKILPHRELNHPISLFWPTKYFHIRLCIFCHYQKRFSCDPQLWFISRSVQLAHITKKNWEKENSIEYRISFLPKRIFGVNRAPKILVNVANFFEKTNCYCQWVVSRNQNSLKLVLCFSADIEQSLTHRELNQPISLFGLQNFSI